MVSFHDDTSLLIQTKSSS